MELDISDCGSIEDGALDEELVSATIEAFNTGKLTPLLKTELKYRIQKKCFEEGKDLTLDEEPPMVQRKAPVSLQFYKYWFSNSVFSFPYFVKKKLIRSKTNYPTLNLVLEKYRMYISVQFFINAYELAIFINIFSFIYM